MLVMTIWHPGIKTRKQVTDLIASALCSPHYLLSTVSVVSTVLYNIYSVDIYYLVSTIYCIRSIYTVLYNIYTVDICRGVFVAKVCVC